MMKKKLPILIGSLLAVFVLAGAIGASVVYAQEGTPPTPSGMPDDERGPRGGRGFGGPELQAVADVLGMTTDELQSALKSGQTLEQIAVAAGMDLQTVHDAVSAARQEALKARIEQGLTDGTISQEKADWLLEGLEKGFLDGPGFGFGGPHGQPGERPNKVDQSTGQ